MKRWQKDYSITKREFNKHYQSHVKSNKNWTRNRIGVSAYVVDCKCDEQKGRFRKKDAFDCGIAKCLVCHSDKYPKRSKTKQELDFDLKYKEQIND